MRLAVASLGLLILASCSEELPTPPVPTVTIPLFPCCGAPPERLIHDPRILDQAATIILVRVIGLGMQEPAGPFPHPTMLVIRSWKGPFSAGEVLHTKGPSMCNGRIEDCVGYPFQSGDQGKYFLIMNGEQETEMTVRRYEAWPAEKSQALMAALDQAVALAARLEKERVAIEELTGRHQEVLRPQFFLIGTPLTTTQQDAPQ
jgi:hypothetical protein